MNTASFSPDGRVVASGAQDRNIRLWDASTGKLLRTLEGHKSHIDQFRFSPDGGRLVSSASLGNDDVPIVWDVLSGEELFRLPGHLSVNDVSFDHDGTRIVTASSHEHAWCWDAYRGDVTFKLDGFKSKDEEQSLDFSSDDSSHITTVSFSHDDRWIITGSWDATGRIFDAKTGRLKVTLQGHDGWVTVAQFARSGDYALTGSLPLETSGNYLRFDNTVRLWNVASGEQQSLLHDGSEEVNVATFDRNGRQVAVAAGKEVRIWSLPGHQGSCSRPFVPRGGDDKVEKDEPDSPTIRLRRAVLRENGSSDPAEVVFHPTRDILAIAGWSKAGVHLFDTASSVQIGYCEQSTGTVPVFSPRSGDLLAPHDVSSFGVWDSTSGKLRFELKADSKHASHGQFSNDGGWIVTADHGNAACIWDAENGQLMQRLVGHTDRVSHATFSPRGDRVATCSSDNTVKIWNRETGECLQTCVQSVPEELVSASPKSGIVGEGVAGERAWFDAAGTRLLVAQEYGTLQQWDTTTGKPLYSIQTGSLSTDATISPDGTSILTGFTDHSARLWNASTGRQFARLNEHRGHVNHVAFAEDGKHFVATGRRSLVWDTGSRLRVGALRSNNSASMFVPGQDLILSKSSDGARIHDFYPVPVGSVPCAEIISALTGTRSGDFSGMEFIPAAIWKERRKQLLVRLSASLQKRSPENRLADAIWLLVLDHDDVRAAEIVLQHLISDDEDVRQSTAQFLLAVEQLSPDCAGVFSAAIDAESDFVRTRIRRLLSHVPMSNSKIAAVLPPAMARGRIERTVLMSMLGNLDESDLSVESVLQAAVNDRDIWVANAACSAIGRLRLKSPAVLDGLVKGLWHESPIVRRAAASALVEVGPACIPRVISELESATKISAESVQVLEALGSQSAFGVTILIGLSKSEIRAVSEAAVATLVRIGPTARADLERELESPEGKSRIAAIDALSQFGPAARASIPKLVNSLGDPEERVRDVAAVALAALGESAIGDLIDGLSSTNLALQKGAALAMEKMGRRASRAAPALVVALGSEHKPMRLAAGEALIAIQADAIPDLMKAFADKNRFTRANAVSVVGRLGQRARAAIPDVVRLLDDPELLVRQNAIAALLAIEEGNADSLLAQIQGAKAEYHDSLVLAVVLQSRWGKFDDLVGKLLQDEQLGERIIPELIRLYAEDEASSALGALERIGTKALPAMFINGCASREQVLE